MAEIILPPEENEEIPQIPELNIDKPTENSKVITIEFEARKTNKVSTKDTNQQLYTTDTDAWFEFKETSLEGANGTYSVVFRNRHDGSIFQRTGDVVSGVAYYKIPQQEIRHAGAWRGQVVYTLSNGDTTSREFGYDVKGHMLDGKDVREIVVEDFETLMSQLRSMKDNAEVELANLVNTANQNETDRQAFFDDLVDDIDELQANYQELLDTGVLQTNINTKLEQLEEEYAPKLTEVTAQLAQKVGNGKLASMSDLGQDIKTAMTGGSVAVVGEGAVTKINLANDVRKEIEGKVNIADELTNEHVLRVLPNGVRDYRVNNTIVKNTKYVELDGTEDWSGSTVGDFFNFRLPINDIMVGVTERYILERENEVWEFAYSLGEFRHFYVYDDSIVGGEFRVFIERSVILSYSGDSKIERFANFLMDTGGPLEFTYQLAEPVEIQLPSRVTPNTRELIRLSKQGVKLSNNTFIAEDKTTGITYEWSIEVDKGIPSIRLMKAGESNE